MYRVQCDCDSSPSIRMKQNIHDDSSCGCTRKAGSEKVKARFQAKTNAGLCKAINCIGVIHNKNLRYCVKHYRFSNMKSRACNSAKYSPSFAELEALIPSDMICIGCKRPMNWTSAEGPSTLITLQHDRSGKLRMICLACNTKHASQPNDSFYEIPSGHWRCPQCKKIKPLKDFQIDNGRSTGRISVCAECHYERGRKWRLSNPERCRAYSRAYYQRNRERCRSYRRAYYRRQRRQSDKR